MKKLLFILLVLTITAVAWGNSTPVVSGVSVSQRSDDSKLVDIYYNLSDADGDNCTVWIAVSDDGGATWDVPAFTVSGHIWENITPGTNKHIIWDAGHDCAGKVGTFKARVVATDGNGDNMVLVSAGIFEYDRTESVFVPSYMIDKYEVTNQQYAEFLNSADPQGDYYSTSMEIERYGTVNDYYYIADNDKENYPVRYVSFYDAQAYAQWKSDQTGLNYHLPDQYQWQKAAGWDPVLEKLWTYGYQSNSATCSYMNYNNCVGAPTEVGSYDPYKSYYGCYDMSGNVWEWTTEVDGSYRVIRGGNWYITATYCAVTCRYSYYPSYRYTYYGFRLVLDLN